MRIISGSVGRNGRNFVDDVAIVQQLLGLRRLMFSEKIPEPDADGTCGHKTVTAIAAFQERIVCLPQPDGRIDPLGRTLRTLIHGFTLPELKDLLVARRWLRSTAPRKPPAQRASELLVNYAKRAPKEFVSAYTEEVIRSAMALAGVTSVGISSTLRTIEDQTRIMFDNCSSYPNANSVSELRNMRRWGYSAPGQAVEAIFFKTRGQGAAATRAAMEAKIREFAGRDERVSLHCVPQEVYALRNIVDVPYGSVPVHLKGTFQDVLISMSDKVKNAPGNFHAQGIIGLLIVEDKCWHLEIPQNRATLPVVGRTT